MFNFTSHFEESKIIAVLRSVSHECSVFMEVIWVFFVFYSSQYMDHAHFVQFVLLGLEVEARALCSLYHGAVLILLSTFGSIIRTVLVKGVLTRVLQMNRANRLKKKRNLPEWLTGCPLAI